VSSAARRFDGLHRGAFRGRESHPFDRGAIGCPTEEPADVLGYRRAMNDVMRRAAATLRCHPTAADSAVAVIVAAASIASLSTTFELIRQIPKAQEPSRPAIVLALFAVILPLALRRRFPLTVAGVVVGAFVVGRVLLAPKVMFLVSWEQYLSIWVCWLALYSAVAHGRRSRLATCWIAVLAAVLAGEIVREVYFSLASLKGLPLNQAFQLAYNLAFLVWPLMLGFVVRSLRDRQRELAAQALELQREREENARRAVLEERVRIARELHDVVAHHVSVMGVQAGAARRVMARKPEKAEEVLSSIEESSRQAVVELHRLLGFLRRADQPDQLAPQPDLAQLGALVAQATQAGLSVELSVEGARRPLPPTLEVSAYRVIQEALTNALKHSDGRTATVRVDYTDAALEIEVRDDGSGAGTRPAKTVGGHGLMGMRERVGLHGGHLSVGGAPDGGFAVRATFPLGGSAA
jgi:signal transduction histidine kinase